MRPLKNMERFAKNAAQKNIVKGKILSIDFDRANVVPNGSTGKVNGRIVGDPNTLSVGQEVDIIFGEKGPLVMANAQNTSELYSLESHAPNHARVGPDPLTPEMIGAAKEEHTHDASQISGLESNVTGDLTYVHSQLTPNNVWTVVHSLDKYPSVTVVDSAGTAVVGDIIYNSTNQLTVSFTAAFSGEAYLN